MNVSKEYDPRANQKQRTRSAIVEAAIALLANGVRPTVSDAAAAAKVSRATAYRYFPTQESLLVEVAVSRPTEPIDALLAGLPQADANGNIAALQGATHKLMVDEEASMRMALRAYLDAWFDAKEKGDPAPDVREGRRMRWIDRALGPVLDEMTEVQARRLRAGLALVLGIESLIVMKDVCRFGDDDAADALQWIARVVLNAALTESNK